MRVRSLTRRVLGIVLATQVACAIILCAGALFHELHTRQRAFDESLRGRSDSLLGAIQDAEDPADNVAIDPTELRLPRNDFYAVYNENKSLVGSTHGAPSELVAERSAGFRDQRIEGKTFRIYQRNAMRIIDRAENGGVGLKRPVTIVYASPETHLRHEVLEAAGYYVLLVLVVVAGTGLGVLVILSRALRPLTEFAHVAGQLSAPSLVFAPPPSVLAVTELRPLANALSRVIDDLRDAFKKEKHFVGDAAHELKTAVAVIRSTVQVLMLRPRSIQEHSAGLSRVLEDVTRIESLVGQMLSSASADTISAEVPLLEFATLLSQTITEIEPIATVKGVVLVTEDVDPTWVRITPERASALVSNLVLNAIQHSETGMRVRAVLQKATSGQVVFSVIDTGSGIRPEALGHVFDRFYREDQSRSRHTGGAGLGLSICKSIVEGAGGVIDIHTTLHRGTTVSVTFSEA